MHFSGTIIDGQPPLYLGLYDDFIFFSQSAKFETTFCQLYKAGFQEEISHFLGVNFNITKHNDGHLDISMHQPIDVQNLLTKCNLKDVNPTATPYRIGHPVDTIPTPTNQSTQQSKSNNLHLQEINGILNWLSTQTRPDISTMVNILVQNNHKATKGHIHSTKYVAKYLKGTKNCGILFSRQFNSKLNSFVKFTIPENQIIPLTDANWGLQDASVPNRNDPTALLDLFKSRSIDGFIIWLGRPLHWSSKRQTFTSRSLTKAKIGTIDDCTKELQYITNIFSDLNLLHLFTNGPIPVYNGNKASVQRSHNMTTKGLS